MIERIIQTIKGLFIKAYQSEEEKIYLLLLCCWLEESSELVSQLKLNYQNLDIRRKGVTSELELNKKQQKQYYDRSARRLSELDVVGQQILLQERKRKWKPGVVVLQNGPSDYTVRVEDANYRRNC